MGCPGVPCIGCIGCAGGGCWLGDGPIGTPAPEGGVGQDGAVAKGGAFCTRIRSYHQSF